MILIVVSLIILLPIIWMILVSFQETYSVFVLQSWIPSSLKNYVDALTMQKGIFIRWMFNSAFVSGITVIITLVISTLGGYGFARLNFRGRDILFTLYLSTIMIPFATTMIPLLYLCKQFGLVNTYAGLILPACSNIIPTFWIRQYVKSLPIELEDAARVDGCSEIQVFTHVVFPLLKPSMGVIALYTLWNQWNALLWPVVIVQDMNMYTANLGLTLVTSEEHAQMATNWGLSMALALLTCLPLLIMFILFQKTFVKGLVMGALKA